MQRWWWNVTSLVSLTSTIRIQCIFTVYPVHYVLQVGSKDCIVSQYCQESNAIQALMDTFGMAEESAIEYVTNRTRVQSCSCQDSCAYLGICCQDKTVDIPTRLQPIVSTFCMLQSRQDVVDKKGLSLNNILILVHSDSEVYLDVSHQQGSC